MGKDPLVFDHFELQTDATGLPIRLGTSATGTIYKAVDTRLRKEVALKLFDEHPLEDPARRAQFFEEARAAALVDHPHLARLLDLCPEDAHPCFYAMELVEGESLAARVVGQGALSPGDALSLLRPIADALGALEEHRLIHGDLTPENIIVPSSGNRTGRVKLIGFGLGKPSVGNPSPAVGERSLGSAHFLSPEQIRSREPLDRRSDYYALGATLWFALTGSPPFTGSAFEVQEAHVYRDPAWEKIASAPAPVRALLKSLLAKLRDERPANAAALLAAWDEALASCHGQASFAPFSTPAAVGLKPVAETPDEKPEEHHPLAALVAQARAPAPRRHPGNSRKALRIALLTGAGFVVLLISLLIYSFVISAREIAPAKRPTGSSSPTALPHLGESPPPALAAVPPVATPIPEAMPEAPPAPTAPAPADEPPLEGIGRAEVAVNKVTVNLGEPIAVQLRLYVDSRIPWDLQAAPRLLAEGFTQSKLQEGPIESKTVDGRRYDLLTVKTTVTPQRPGAVKIGPAEFLYTATVPLEVRRERGGFVSDNTPPEPERFKTSSGTVEIQVLDRGAAIAGPGAPGGSRREEVQRFVRDYLAKSDANALEEILQLFSPAVDYLDLGRVDAAAVRRDLERYYTRWPQRAHTLEAQPTIALTPGETSATVTLPLHFEVRNGAATVHGRTEDIMVLDLTGEEPRIVALQSTVKERDRGPAAPPPRPPLPGGFHRD